MKRIRKKILRPGLYRLVNPIGEVYIGQTKNLDRRKKEHIRYAQGNIKCPRLLRESLVKYGFEAHSFEIICELPKDVETDILKNYEYFIYNQYAESGYKMLNIAEGGTGIIMVEESLKIMSEKTKRMWTPEFKENHIRQRTGRPIHSAEEKAKRSKWLKENKHKFKQYVFTKEDTQKGQLAKQKLILERGYFVPPESVEKGRQKKSKVILNVENGIFYHGCREAAVSIGTTEDNLRKKLKGQYKNNTNLVFV